MYKRDINEVFDWATYLYMQSLGLILRIIIIMHAI